MARVVTSTSVRRARAAAAVAGALLTTALLGSAQARPVDTDPIVGFWNYGGGVVQVTGSGSSFSGTIVKATRFSDCDHPVGEVIWRIAKSGDGYTGTHAWFASGAPSCRLGGAADRGPSTWSIDDSGSSLRLHWCTTNPRSSSDTRCSDLTRAKPVQPSQYRFTFSGYGNPQRPFPGYVGPFQLGPVRISGSGTVTKTAGTGTARITASLRAGTHRNPRATLRIVRLLSARTLGGGGTELRIQVRVQSHNYPDICPAGTLGVLRLVDDDRQLKNGQTADGIATSFPSPTSKAPDGGLACRTHVHGFNNTDVTWSDPPRGGYPGGGNWARVNLGVGSTGSGGNSGSGSGKGAQTVKQALALIKAIVTKNTSACGIRSWRISVNGTPGKWKAVATLTLASGTGIATWNIVGAKVAPSNQLAAEVAAGCP